MRTAMLSEAGDDQAASVRSSLGRTRTAMLSEAGDDQAALGPSKRSAMVLEASVALAREALEEASGAGFFAAPSLLRSCVQPPCSSWGLQRGGRCRATPLSGKAL